MGIVGAASRGRAVGFRAGAVAADVVVVPEAGVAAVAGAGAGMGVETRPGPSGAVEIRDWFRKISHLSEVFGPSHAYLCGFSRTILLPGRLAILHCR